VAKVNAIPNMKTFTAFIELKFSRLILHRSAIALFAESIILSALSLDISLRTIFLEKKGRRRLRFAENTSSDNQKARVGIATRITAKPIKSPPL
jgi:hypothetical protein